MFDAPSDGPSPGILVVIARSGCTRVVPVLAPADGSGHGPPTKKAPQLQGPPSSGASRARTGDLLGAIQALSQLSYSPAGGLSHAVYGKSLDAASSMYSHARNAGRSIRATESLETADTNS